MRVRDLVAVGVVSCLVAAFLAEGCARQQDVPVHRVERENFVHKVTAEGLLQAGRTTKLSVPPQVVASVRLAWLLPEGARVDEGDVIARFDAKSMEEKLADAEVDRNQSDRRIDQTKVQKGQRVEELHTDADIADLELVHAQEFQKTDSLVFSRRELMEDSIDEELAAATKAHAEANASTEQELAATELALLEIQRRQAVDEIDEAQQGLEALEVRAPHGGLLTYVRNWRGEPPSIGSEMFRGQSLAEIPDLDSLEAEVYVLEADAGGLTVGQTVEVTVEAHPDLVLKGEVERVDPVAQPRFRGSPVQYFGVVVKLKNDEDDAAGAEQKKVLASMKPGQRVRATVYLENVEDALVVPRQAVHEEDGTSRVWKRTGGGFEPVPVEVGATGLGKVVVASGLAEGDEVALRPPGASNGSAQGPAKAAEAATETAQPAALAAGG